MTTVQLIDRLAVVAAVFVLVVGVAVGAPVVAGAGFWGSLVVGWLLKSWAEDHELTEEG